MTRTSPLDIVFLVDAKASMSRSLSKLPTFVGGLLEKLDNPTPEMRDEFGHGRYEWKIDWRVSIVAFRDSEETPDKWFEPNPFVRGKESVMAQLKAIRPLGNSKTTSLVDALFKIAEKEQTPRDAMLDDPMRWRSLSKSARIVFAITDTPCRMPSPPQPSATLEDLNNKVVESHITFCLLVPAKVRCFDCLSMIDRCEEWCYPGAPGQSPDESLASFLEGRTFEHEFERMIVWQCYAHLHARFENHIYISAP